MSGWNFADVWEAVARRFPEELAQQDGHRSFTWGEFAGRSEALSRGLWGAGLQRQSKVALYLYNGAEYLETTFACFKASLVPVNTNYRYVDEELIYLWTDADIEAVVFHADLSERCARIRDRLPAIREWICVDTDEAKSPGWARSYEQVVATAPPSASEKWIRSGEDLVLLYTGGTTGMPKGVMWEQHALFSMLESLHAELPPGEPDPSVYAELLKRPGPRVYPVAPMMHGTSLFFAMPILNRGGSIFTSQRRHFDTDDVLDTISTARISGIAVVGDVFAKPMVEALDREPERWDLSSWRVLFSAGVMFSVETKRELLEHVPRLKIIDGLSATESGSSARSVTSGSEAVPTAEFTIGHNTVVVDDDGQLVEPGSGRRGRIAVSGFIPLGYHKDPERTAATYQVIGGRRFAVTGDYAQVEVDGTIHLLGRGSLCINTGGEKVFPEEVEEALKAFDGVRDVVVVGTPDERFGESVTALVECAVPDSVDVEEMLTAARARLAGYKIPRRVVFIDSIGRAANGKADYVKLKEYALAALET
ncbi:MAG TPA: AMP-binding protein [Acidimicrobiales bacterium]